MKISYLAFWTTVHGESHAQTYDASFEEIRALDCGPPAGPQGARRGIHNRSQSRRFSHKPTWGQCPKIRLGL